MSKTNKTSSMFKLALPVCLLSAGALSAVLFPPAGASADSAGAEVNTTVGEFIRLAVDTNELILRDSNNNANIAPSASGTLITGDLNVAVSTNTTQGFSISVFTQDNTTSMTHESPSINATIDSVAGATGYDASTGISDLANNTWGFRKQTGESGGNPTYGNWFGVGADETHGTVIENSNSSSSEYCATLAYPLNSSGCASGTYAEHTLNFGAKLIPSLPGGTYANNVVISAVAKSEGQRYTVDFDSNGGSNTMGPRTIIAGSTFTLPSTSNVIKEGYGIAGYAFTSDAASATYTPGQTVTVADFLAAATAAGQTPDSGMTLYIIWQVPEDPTIMQSSNSCSNIPEGQTATLTDSRDNQEYTVYHIPSNATYPDTSTVADVAGKCIMTKDLNLGAVASVEGSASTIVANGAMTLSPEDSNFTTPTGSGESITVPTTSVSITNGTGNWSSTNSYSNKQYTTSGTGDYANRGYYSWGAAMTVCPKGWRLPTQDEYNNNDSDWNASTTGISKLVNNNISTIKSSPWSFVLGGYYYGMFSTAGSYGFYWSSAQYNSENSYYLLLKSSSGLKRSNDNKYNGFSVRCIAD